MSDILKNQCFIVFLVLPLCLDTLFYKTSFFTKLICSIFSNFYKSTYQSIIKMSATNSPVFDSNMDSLLLLSNPRRITICHFSKSLEITKNKKRMKGLLRSTRKMPRKPRKMPRRLRKMPRRLRKKLRRLEDEKAAKASQGRCQEG